MWAAAASESHLTVCAVQVPCSCAYHPAPTSDAPEKVAASLTPSLSPPVLTDGAADTEGDSSTDQPDGIVTNIHIT
jgi:hypothetical protein